MAYTTEGVPFESSAGSVFEHAGADAASKRREWTAAIGLLLLVFASRIPFLLTHHVQDDAYISARAMRNLAMHGDLAFNLGDRYSPVTSIIWGYLGAIPAAMLPADHLMLGLQLIGIVCIGMAVLLARRIFLERAETWVSAALALCSPALFASYLGMETGLAILYLIALAFALARPLRTRRLLFALIAVGPLVRPEFIAVSAVATGLAWTSLELPRSEKYFLVLAPMTGALAYVTLNLAQSGELVSPSAIAKIASYHPERSIPLFLRRLVMVLSGQLVFPSVKQLPAWLYALANLIPLGLVVWRLRGGAFRLSQIRDRLLTFALFIAYGLPCIFCWGGQFAQWYLFPSGFFAVLLALSCVPERLRSRSFLAPSVLAVTGAIAAMQLALSFSAGTQEFDYRAGVGRWIHEHSAPGDTLLLEPAGHIPYFAGLETFDDVGLVSSRVLSYIQAYGAPWWFRFVREHWPTWIVDRHDLRRDATSDSWYTMTVAEHRCFLARYELAHLFHYDPHEYASNALSLRILQMGSHANYYVFRLRTPTGPTTGCSPD